MIIDFNSILAMFGVAVISLIIAGSFIVFIAIYNEDGGKL